MKTRKVNHRTWAKVLDNSYFAILNTADYPNFDQLDAIEEAFDFDNAESCMFDFIEMVRYRFYEGRR